MTSGLPALLVLTDRRACEARGVTLVATVEAVARAAGREAAVIIREKDLEPERRIDLGRQLAAVAGDTPLVVAGDPRLAAAIGTRWVHLSAADGVPPDGLQWGRSCHDRDELARAAAEGAAYATISPVFPTASKPGYGPALGIHTLTEHCAATSLPLYALGGITAETAGKALDAGAAGIAVMGAVMAATDPAGAVSGLLAALVRA